jgi:hypothetical protein
MSEILITLLRLSVMALALAAKGNPGGIVRQQIETMGLRQWLSLVSLWLVESVYAEIATVHDFSAAAFRQKPVKIQLRFISFRLRRERTAGVNWLFRPCGAKGCIACVRLLP